LYRSEANPVEYDIPENPAIHPSAYDLWRRVEARQVLKVVPEYPGASEDYDSVLLLLLTACQCA
jgi:hypothetical protein